MMKHLPRLFITALIATALVSAQEFRSVLTGRVLDAQAAVVPNAKVIAVHQQTSANYETISGADGLYTLPFLPPGGYRILGNAPGFKQYVREGVQISSNERVPLDILLEVGQITETVTVTADAGILQTATASTGQVIDSAQIETMPVAARTPLMLAQLSFGVVPTGNPQWQRPFFANGPSDFSMGGAPSQSNELLMDGAPNTTGMTQAAYSPPMDAVLELKVETFQADAAYGHTGGGTVNMVLKSGTNEFHGVAGLFNQVSALASTPFFTNRAGQKKPVTRFNQWGVTAGGPVVIPRVIDGRNRLFFYFGYEGVKESLPTPFIETVPTAAERSGDFSALLRLNSAYQLYDPATASREGTRVRRQPFPGNIIPPARLHAVGKNYMQFYPAPNQAGTADGQNNYLSGTIRTDNYHNELGRLDAIVSNSHKLFWNIRHYEMLEERWNRFGNPSTGNFLFRNTWGSTFDDVYTFNATTVLNTRMNWTHYTEGNRNFSTGYDFSQLGFPQSLVSAAPSRVIPRLNLGAMYGLGESADRSVPFNNFQIFSSLMKVAGPHTLKFGADIRLLRECSLNWGFSSGSYNFGGWVRGPLDNSPAAPFGGELASLLLGLADGGYLDNSATRANQAGYHAFFLHDDFRVRRGLTLNLGIRYDRDIAATERYNRNIRGFDFATPSPISAAASAAYARNPIAELPASQFRTVGGQTFAGPNARSFYNTQAHYFSPRFGFAWTPGFIKSTVIRGGAGVFFFPLNINGVNQTGFSQSTALVSTLDGGLTANVNLGNPFPGGIEQPPGAALGIATNLGRNISFPNTNPSNPYSTRWSLAIQRELTPNTSLEVGYEGNHAVKMLVTDDLNFVPESFLSKSPVRDQVTIDRLTAQVSNPFSGLVPNTSLDGSVVQRQQLLKPYPHFTALTEGNLNPGSSYFHMLQTRLERRFSRGLQLQASYQYAKLIEKRTRLNASDMFLEKRLANEDRPHRFITSATYALPFGRGKAAGAQAPHAVRALIEGWNLSGIYTYQLGQPLNWGNVIYNGGDLQMDPRAIDRAFDTTRFNTNSREQLASNVRTFPSRFGNLRQEGRNNFDLAILKNTYIAEKVYVQIRGEFFNTLNHPTFDAPNVNPTSTAFGRITLQANNERRVQLAMRLVW